MKIWQAVSFNEVDQLLEIAVGTGEHTRVGSQSLG